MGKLINDRTKVFFLLHGLGPQYETFTIAILKLMFLLTRNLTPYSKAMSLGIRVIYLIITIMPWPSLAKETIKKKENNQYFSSKGCEFVQTEQQGVNQSDRKKDVVSNQVIQNFDNRPQSQRKNTSLECQIRGNLGHVSLRCWNRFNQLFMPKDIAQALAAMNIANEN